MDRAIENVMRLAGVSLIEAVTMATVNPARIGRVVSRQRGLCWPGESGPIWSVFASIRAISGASEFSSAASVFSRQPG